MCYLDSLDEGNKAMTLAKSYTTKSFALTDKGLLRQKNEDSFGCDDLLHFYSIADGLGGRNAGEIASSETVHRLHKKIQEDSFLHHLPTQEKMIVDFFIQSIIAVNHEIFSLSRNNHQLEGMGTTLSTLYFFNEKCLFTNIGDSRIYRFRNNELKQLTNDDTLLEELLQYGLIDEKEAKVFPLKHVITKSIGSFETIDPSFGIETLQINDIYLLCSDGLHGLVSPEKIKSILAMTSTIEEKGELLLKNALSAGGIDNITLILVEIPS